MKVVIYRCDACGAEIRDRLIVLGAEVGGRHGYPMGKLETCEACAAPVLALYERGRERLRRHEEERAAAQREYAAFATEQADALIAKLRGKA